jgi:hypothetical protein
MRGLALGAARRKRQRRHRRLRGDLRLARRGQAHLRSGNLFSWLSSRVRTTWSFDEGEDVAQAGRYQSSAVRMCWPARMWMVRCRRAVRTKRSMAQSVRSSSPGAQIHSSPTTNPQVYALHPSEPRPGDESQDLDRHGHVDRPDWDHHHHRPGAGRGRRADGLPDGPGHRGPSRDALLLPGRRALCMAENATHNLYNLLTLRGPWSATRTSERTT